MLLRFLGFRVEREGFRVERTCEDFHNVMSLWVIKKKLLPTQVATFETDFG